MPRTVMQLEMNDSPLLRKDTMKHRISKWSSFFEKLENKVHNSLHEESDTEEISFETFAVDPKFKSADEEYRKARVSLLQELGITEDEVSQVESKDNDEGSEEDSAGATTSDEQGSESSDNEVSCDEGSQKDSASDDEHGCERSDKGVGPQNKKELGKSLKHLRKGKVSLLQEDSNSEDELAQVKGSDIDKDCAAIESDDEQSSQSSDDDYSPKYKIDPETSLRQLRKEKISFLQEDSVSDDKLAQNEGRVIDKDCAAIVSGNKQSSQSTNEDSDNPSKLGKNLDKILKFNKNQVEESISNLGQCENSENTFRYKRLESTLNDVESGCEHTPSKLNSLTSLENLNYSSTSSTKRFQLVKGNQNKERNSSCSSLISKRTAKSLLRNLETADNNGAENIPVSNLVLHGGQHTSPERTNLKKKRTGDTSKTCHRKIYSKTLRGGVDGILINDSSLPFNSVCTRHKDDGSLRPNVKETKIQDTSGIYTPHPQDSSTQQDFNNKVPESKADIIEMYNQYALWKLQKRRKSGCGSLHIVSNLNEEPSDENKLVPISSPVVHKPVLTPRRFSLKKTVY